MKSVRCSPFLFDKLCKVNLLFMFLPICAFMSPPMMRTLFQDAMNKRGYHMKEGDEIHFFTNIGRAVAGDDCFTGVAIKCRYHHPHLYFLNAI